MNLGLLGYLSFILLMVGSFNVLFGRLLEEDKIFMLMLVWRRLIFWEMIKDFLDAVVVKEGLQTPFSSKASEVEQSFISEESSISQK